MHELISWCGFFGSWLLVAGPVYQAALELQEQAMERDEIEAAGKGVSQPPPVSPWWWLVPPVKYVLERRRDRAFRRDFLHALSPRQVESLVNFLNKATGWLAVGTGGLLLAIKETGELVEYHEHWPQWLFWLLAPVMLLIAVASVSILIRRSALLLANAEPTGETT
jgi:hypothetical protein